MTDHDVYSFGVVASSTHYAIEGAFPAPEGYAEIASVSHMIGCVSASAFWTLT